MIDTNLAFLKRILCEFSTRVSPGMLFDLALKGEVIIALEPLSEGVSALLQKRRISRKIEI